MYDRSTATNKCVYLNVGIRSGVSISWLLEKQHVHVDKDP